MMPGPGMDEMIPSSGALLFPPAGEGAAGGLIEMDHTGFLVVANLTGCASAVAVRAANACLRSIAPPLQTEAEASVWETGEGGRKTLPIYR